MNRLEWSGCRNTRDLGGLPAGDGVVRDRALVRSDSLTRLDEDGLRDMRAYGVARVVDLRGEHETGDPPHPFAGTPKYLSVPWLDVSLDADAELVDFYLGSLTSNTTQIARAVRGFVEAPQGPVVVHCAIGKDRTGIVVSVLLTLAGVPREEVVADYAASAELLGVEEYLAAMDPDERPRAARFAHSDPAVLGRFLDEIESSYGGVAAFLTTACGLEPRELEAARARLVRPRPQP